MRSKILLVVVAIVAILGIGVGIAFLAAHGPSQSPPGTTPIVDNSTPQPPAAPVHIAKPAQNPTQEAAPVITVPVVPIIHPGNSNALANTSGSDTNWEEKIDDIVGSDDPDTNKVQKLYALFPKLPPDGQEEAAQHLSNLVDDEDYAPLGEMLKNDKLPEGVLDELLADLLNRPNSLKLPLLLDLAGNPNHVKHDESKDLLELYLGEDYGDDWNSWKTHMTNWLQQNPD
jgi:hypothetical protein